jgi:hypothetical protein
MTVLTSTASVQFDQGGPAEVSATVRLNGGSRIYCHRYEDSAPILSITDEHVRMSVSVPDPDHVTAQDVSFGRLLAETVARYVAELEKLAASAAGDGQPSGRAA